LDTDAERRHELAQFIQQAACSGVGLAGEGDADEHGPFDHSWFFFNVVHEVLVVK
jgi:hypothetical protein